MVESPSQNEQSLRRYNAGVEIFRKAVKSKASNHQTRLLVHHLQELFRNINHIIALEKRLCVKPSNSWKELFITRKREILRIIGKNQRLFRKGEHTWVGPDLWSSVLELKRLSIERRRQLGMLKRQMKRVQKRRLQRRPERIRK